MSLAPYLAFPGTARAAFEFYQTVFGGELSIMDMSALSPEEAAGMGDTPADAVMHATLNFGGGSLMGADGPPDVVQTGMCSMYELDDDAEAERVFTALAEGGTIVMPIAPTSFASNYGLVTDRFGTPWMIYSANLEFAAQFR